MKPGDIVTYQDLSLQISGFRGKIIEISGPVAAGNVMVNWFSPPNPHLPANNRCRECDFNLRVIK